MIWWKCLIVVPLEEWKRVFVDTLNRVKEIEIKKISKTEAVDENYTQ